MLELLFISRFKEHWEVGSQWYVGLMSKNKTLMPLARAGIPDDATAVSVERVQWPYDPP